MLDAVLTITENTKRNDLRYKPYDPLTGEGCSSGRFKLCVTDAPQQELWLPNEMLRLEIIQDLKRTKSIASVFLENEQRLDEETYTTFWVGLCELRYRYDFEFYAYTCCTISDKVSAQDVPFVLNRGQRRLLEKLEAMRRAGKPIRVILLKARQWGGSTLIQQYMGWIQTIHRKNWNSVICAHIKDAAVTIRAMLDKTLSAMPPIGGRKYSLRNFQNTQNIKYISERGCKITVGSAEEPNSVRSQDAKLVHFSEIGLYPNTEKKLTEDLVSSIIGSILMEPYTLIAYESTAKGIGDFFHSEWEKATAGDSVYSPVFVPWFLIDIYREEFDGTYYNHRGKKIKGSVTDFVKTLTEYEINLFTNEKECTLENLNWYRGKLSEMTSPSLMRQEFPSNALEAFQDSGMPAFRADDIEAMRKNCTPPISVGDLYSDCSPSAAKLDPDKRGFILSNVGFREDPTAMLDIQSSDPTTRSRKTLNKLKVWVHPDPERIKGRYVVVVDTGGRSEKADFSVIRVFDRYWQMYGGLPEIAAEWRGHIDHDLLVWISAMVARHYNDALLVIESNTHETENTDGDHSEFIFDVLSQYYPNLYSRTPADKILEGVPPKWGFHTNVSTKTMLVDTYTAVLREKGYLERDEEALNEARVYEKKKNGKFGAKEGKHDDVLMCTMIGLYVCYDLPLPVVLEETRSTYASRKRSEADI